MLPAAPTDANSDRSCVPARLFAVTETRDERMWHEILTNPVMGIEARLFRHLPSDPRCLLCRSPYRAPFGPVLKLLGYGRSARYPQLCRPCFRHMDRNRGGAEITLTVLFADVRGSTAIAERTSAGEFSRLLERFYGSVTEAVRSERGVIDKFLGDGVMALFIPSFTDLGDASHAVHAARRILAEADLPIGIGVNSGPAYTGFLGASSEVASFTAVGDAVNVAHRLGEAAAAGELIVSAETATAAELDASGWQMRELMVKGREQPVAIWSQSAISA